MESIWKKKKQPIGSEQLLQILLEYFLIRLLRDHIGEDRSETAPRSAVPIQELIDYVRDNFLEKITLDELAFLFKTNRATLCREFKTITGMTVVEFINQQKIELAKKKIIETDDTFTKIAESLNFESIHYFTRFFKKMTGMTPKDFRRQARSI